MTRRAAFKSSDLDRAISVAQKRGVDVAAYEIAPDGTIRILTSQGGAALPSDQQAEDAWDKALGLQ